MDDAWAAVLWWPQLWFPSPGLWHRPHGQHELSMAREQQDQAGAEANPTTPTMSPEEQINTHCTSLDSCSARGHCGIAA